MNWRATSSLTLLLVVSAVLLAGCGDNRHEVRGIVTWHGEPVPKGVVYFEPSKELGDIPTGFALIDNGRFRTEPDSGCHPGPHVARIKGYDGKPKPLDVSLAAERIPGYEDEPSLAVGETLFEEVTVPVEIVVGRDELEFHLPIAQ